MSRTTNPITKQQTFDGSSLVFPAITGGIYTLMMDPDNADAADANTERWTSATGCKAFRVVPKGPAAALAALDGILYGWSTTAADLTAVNAAMAALATEVATPGTGSVGTGNVAAIFPAKQADGTTGWSGDLDWKLYDGTTPIKTIAVRSVGADYPEGVMVQYII